MSSQSWSLHIERAQRQRSARQRQVLHEVHLLARARLRLAQALRRRYRVDVSLAH